MLAGKAASLALKPIHDQRQSELPRMCNQSVASFSVSEQLQWIAWKLLETWVKHTSSFVIFDAPSKRSLIPGPKSGLASKIHGPSASHASAACMNMGILLLITYESKP